MNKENCPISRNTEQRQVIFEELAKLHTHPTADELYNIVKNRLPKISLGTVYRNLEFLAKTGEITKLELSGAQKRFDGKKHAHYHLRCQTCQKIFDLPLKQIAELDSALGTIEGFEITSFRLEFNGLCPNCQKKAK
ncbi:MAG: transcriptional repressor [Pseudomonadota bacterium]